MSLKRLQLVSPLHSVVNLQPVSEYFWTACCSGTLGDEFSYYNVDNEKGQSAKDLSVVW